jgi:hypothetical protein
MGSGSRGIPAGFVTDVQKVVGKLGLPHYVLAVVTALSSVLLSAYLGGGTGPAGPAGPAGKPATTTPIGVCIYYGLNEAGKKGLHLLTPSGDGTCTKGWYLSLKPGS